MLVEEDGRERGKPLDRVRYFVLSLKLESP